MARMERRNVRYLGALIDKDELRDQLNSNRARLLVLNSQLLAALVQLSEIVRCQLWTLFSVSCQTSIYFGII